MISFSGTSMAAPMVTGSIALLKQKNPNWSVEEIRQALRATAFYDSSKSVFDQGYGVLSLQNLLKTPLLPAVSLTPASATADGSMVILNGYSGARYRLWYQIRGFGGRGEWTSLSAGEPRLVEGELFRWNTRNIKSGDYLVKIETDGLLKSRDIILVKIDRKYPYIILSSDYTAGPPPKTVKFQAQIYNLPSCVAWSFYFGDGAVYSATPSCGDSNAIIPLRTSEGSHTYVNNGIYSAKVISAGVESNVVSIDLISSKPAVVGQQASCQSGRRGWRGNHGQFIGNGDTRFLCNNGNWVTTAIVNNQSVAGWGFRPMQVPPCTQQGDFFSNGIGRGFVKGHISQAVECRNKGV